MMVKIEVELTQVEFERLQELAAAQTAMRRKKKLNAPEITINDCVRGFARSCQPNGGGWEHPAKASR